SGPMPSPAITATRCVTNGPSAHQPIASSFEASRTSACQAVRPPDVERAATTRTLEIPFLRLATVRAEPHVAVRRQDAAAVLALLVRQHVGRPCNTKSRRTDRGYGGYGRLRGRVCNGR